MGRLLGWGVVLALVAAACTNTPVQVDLPATTSSSTTPTTLAPPSSTSSTSSTTTTHAASGPGRGGTAVIADDQYPPTLNPYAPGGDNFIVAIIGQAWLTGVWEIDGYTLERIPEVVTELPTVANGGVVVNNDGTMTVTYKIREEAVWSDGVPISGDDFAFTTDTVLELEETSDLGSTYTDLNIVSKAAGPKTFSVTLQRPTIAHEQLFQWLIPKHAVDGTNIEEDWNTTTWPSGGPFVLDTIEEFKRITFVRNELYWKTDPDTGIQLPFLDSVEFVYIPEIENLISDFVSRRVDVINPPPNVETLERLEKLEADGAVMEVVQGPVWEHVNFQFSNNRLDISPDSCNNNLSFRKAIMHAIDRDAAALAATGGYGEAMSSFLDAFTPSLSSGAWDQYPYDQDVARALYATAVAETGRECSAVFSTTNNADMRILLAEMYEEMLAEVGIPFDLQLWDSSIFFGEMLEAGTWDIGQWAWVGSHGLLGAVGILDVFNPSSPPPDGSNFYRWGTRDSTIRDKWTTRFAEIVATLDQTVDGRLIVELLTEAEQILADQAVILPLFQRLSVGAVWADEIGGFKFNASSRSHTWNIESWYRTDR